MNVIREILHI